MRRPETPRLFFVDMAAPFGGACVCSIIGVPFDLSITVSGDRLAQFAKVRIRPERRFCGKAKIPVTAVPPTVVVWVAAHGVVEIALVVV